MKAKEQINRIICLAPIDDRMNDTGKYKKIYSIVDRYKGADVVGGGYGFGSYYEVAVHMPKSKVTRFRETLKKNKIRSRNWGVPEN